jgi:hypothetical protein
MQQANGIKYKINLNKSNIFLSVNCQFFLDPAIWCLFGPNVFSRSNGDGKIFLIILKYILGSGNELDSIFLGLSKFACPNHFVRFRIDEYHFPIWKYSKIIAKSQVPKKINLKMDKNICQLCDVSGHLDFWEHRIHCLLPH